MSDGQGGDNGDVVGNRETGGDGGSGRERDPAAVRYEAFRRGERPDDVLVYIHRDAVDSTEPLLDVGTRVDEGVVLVLPGEKGKAAFESATGLDPMDFAGTAMETTGDVDDDCAGGDCPDAGDDSEGAHAATFVFAFAEERNESVGGIYAEGDVIHGYAACDCGTTYADRWVAGS